MDVLALAGFIFTMSVTPGPNVIMIAQSGVDFGFRKSIPHILGITLGFTALGLIVALGFGSIVLRFPIISTSIRFTGAAYLGYLAARIALTPIASVSESQQRKAQSFLESTAFQFANPKAWVMALVSSAFLMRGPSPQPIHYLAYCAIVICVLGPCVVGWNLFGLALRGWLEKPFYRRMFNLIMAVLLLASAIELVVSDGPPDRVVRPMVLGSFKECYHG